MISFYPGPSKLDPLVPELMYQAGKKGILSINHRSKEFVEISKKTIDQLKKKLLIPKDYTIFYTSSATECWEIIAQSLIEKKSYHIYNGAFGEKWFEYTNKLKPESEGFKFNYNQDLNISDLKIKADTELICLVQNETSNATQIQNKTLHQIRNQHPNQLIAIDATSSMAGVKLDFSNGDIWFASVQKCFGLPAGMALLICSPAAIKRSVQLKENNHYNSLNFMIDKIKDYQTTYTPNVLGIYLLMELMKKNKSINTTDKLIKSRIKNWYTYFEKFKEVSFLIEKKENRSDTVLSLTTSEEKIKLIKEKAKKEGILLGNGYGQWASTTFRIANFPAHSEKDIKILQAFLKKHLK
jgi:phosphoserine aminotransferase